MLADTVTSSMETFYHTCRLSSEAETLAFGERIATQLVLGDTVTLAGGLGAGKTTLARGIVRRLLPREEVPSPTFTLAQIYETPRLSITHADLYRVKSVSEVRELGLDEALERGALLVEWPDRMGGLLAQDRLDVILSVSEIEHERVAQVIARGSWVGRIVGGSIGQGGRG